jgi:hypothetical protein
MTIGIDGRTFGSQGRLRHLRNDDVDLELHQLWKSIELPFREPILDGDVFFLRRSRARAALAGMPDLARVARQTSATGSQFWASSPAAVQQRRAARLPPRRREV